MSIAKLGHTTLYYKAYIVEEKVRGGLESDMEPKKGKKMKEYKRKLNWKKEI